MAEHVLVVDDETNMRWVLKEALGEMGYEVRVAAGGEEALVELARAPADLVVLDLKLKGMDGLGTLRRLRERWPDTVVLILTAYGTLATCVEAMQLGAADYLRKPFDVEEIGFKIGRALERRALQTELRKLQATRAQPPLPPAGAHPAWLDCLEQVRSLIALELDIVFVGERGVGRRTLARYAHAIGDRRDAPLVELDLRGVPPEAQRRLLIGERAVEGVWHRAGSGTLLLIASELLTAEGWRTLAELVGATARRRARLLLTAEIAPRGQAALEAGSRVLVPPLRDRLSDISVLARWFAPTHDLTPSALRSLEGYHWPGNLVELRSVVERAASLAGDASIDERHLPAGVRWSSSEAEPIHLPPEGLSMEQLEISLIRQALQRAGGNKSRAAELLGLSRHTLLYRLEKYGLEHDSKEH